ncbi:MAG: VWA domain-containing protein [Anaerolineaceae bacterium]|nr:VWA domain-containing protein [Anaerolineaceae bacterium]
MRHAINRNTETIKRFYITEADGYSEFWRKNKSPVEIIELARLLQALRKIASYIGRNVGDIVWSGMTIEHGVALDPTPIMGKYPIPPAKTDIMVGLMAQAALEKTEWSDRLKTIALSQIELPPHYQYKLSLYIDMCEKIYLDCLSNRSVLGNYTEKAREWSIVEKGKQFIHPPTVTELFHLWWQMAADRNGKGYKENYVDRSVGGIVARGSLERLYKKPIALLNSIVGQLINECVGDSAGVTERINSRLRLYLSIWPELLKYIRFWPGDRADPFLLSDKFKDDIEKEDEEKKAIKATLVSFAEPIERAIKKSNKDFTEKVKSNVKNIDDVVRIEGSDIVMPAKNRIDKKLFYRLQLEFKIIAQQITRYNRGLTSGKIDRRRLYRAATNGTTFQLKKKEFQVQNNFVLLVDATGSMSEPNKWSKTETIFQTLFSVIVQYNKSARLFAYNEVKNTCRLTELYIGGEFYSVMSHGQTASGEAIIATALNLKPSIKKPFIIHLTDGASNWGCGVKDAIIFCKKKNIRLLTIGINCDPASKQSLREEYGKLVQFLDNMNDLPALVKSLLMVSR